MLFEKTKFASMCDDSQGVLPACAPLAVPYVPFQQTGSRKYSQTDALNNGTLFPGLNLPFRYQVEARNVVSSPMSELQALEFVLLELSLYLDTHPDDTEAFELFRQYNAMHKTAHEQYARTYGPITHADVANDSTYTWPKAPWPWQLEGGK